MKRTEGKSIDREKNPNEWASPNENSGSSGLSDLNAEKGKAGRAGVCIYLARKVQHCHSTRVGRGQKGEGTPREESTKATVELKEEKTVKSAP